MIGILNVGVARIAWPAPNAMILCIVKGVNIVWTVPIVLIATNATTVWTVLIAKNVSTAINPRAAKSVSTAQNAWTAQTVWIATVAVASRAKSAGGKIFRRDLTKAKPRSMLEYAFTIPRWR